MSEILTHTAALLFIILLLLLTSEAQRTVDYTEITTSQGLNK